MPNDPGEADQRATARGWLDPPYTLIRDRFRKGRVIPFLGAGASLVSRPVGSPWSSPASPFPPASRELAEYLDRRSGYPSTLEPDLDELMVQIAELTKVRASLESERRNLEIERDGLRTQTLGLQTQIKEANTTLAEAKADARMAGTGSLVRSDYAGSFRFCSR